MTLHEHFTAMNLLAKQQLILLVSHYIKGTGDQNLFLLTARQLNIHSYLLP